MNIMDALWPSDKLEHLGRCPVCEDSNRILVHEALRDKLFHCSEDRWNLYACAACGTHYLDPRPNQESIDRAYAAYLTHEAPASPHPPASKPSFDERFKCVLRALANGYRNARWGTRFTPEMPLGRYVVPCIPFLRDALLQQMRNLPRCPGPDARLLDVGCGNGGFLELARSAGWSVQGMDFDAAAVATARGLGLDIQQGGLELLQRSDAGSFAWISFSHVLEHVHAPLSWLRELHRLIKPGGTLWLQTPNIGSIGHARYGKNWRGLEPPRHLTLWTLDTLCRGLKEVGFRQVRPKPTPVVTAMDLCASAEALRSGMDYAAFMASPAAQRRRMRYLWPAVLQRCSVRRAEFHTLIATK